MELQFVVDQLAILQNQFNFLVGAIRGAETLADVQKALVDLSSITLEGPIEQALDGKWAIMWVPSQPQLNILDLDLALRDDDGKVWLFNSKEEAEKVGNELLPRIMSFFGFSGFSVFGGPA